MSLCTKSGCRSQAFFDTDRCFNHQHGALSSTAAIAWFLFCAVLAVGFLGVIVWAIIQTVLWLTAR